MTTARSVFFTLTLLLTMASAAVGQTTVLLPVPSTTVLEFDHDNVGTDGYAIWVDGARTVVSTVSPSVGVRRTAFPALTPGTHTIEFTAFVVVDGTTFESAKSATLTVRIVVIPATPGLPRIVTVTTTSPNGNALRAVPQGFVPATSRSNLH